MAGRRNRPARGLAAAGLLASAFAATAGPSPATPEVSLEATIGATNRSAATTAADADLPVLLRPRLRLQREGRLALGMDAALVLVGSAAGRAPVHAWPDIDAGLHAILVERLLSLDAAARLRPVAIDPFGARADVSGAGDRRTEQAYRIGPVLRAEPWPGGLLLGRRLDAWTLDNAGSRDGLRASRTELLLAHAPAPVGAAVSLARLESRIQGIPGSALALQTARASLSAGPGAGLEFGLDAGADHTHAAGLDRGDPLWALRMAWRPSERTGVSALLEQRFFGRGGELSLHERTPWMSLVMTVARQPFLVAQSQIDDTASLRTALDAILTTRTPDPAARGALVDALVRGLGMDTSAFGPAGTQAPYPQLQTRSEGSWTLLSSRSSVSLAFYERSYKALSRRGQPLAPAALDADTRQHGLSLQANRRLTPVLALDMLWRAERIQGLRGGDAPRSTEVLARIWLTKQLSARAEATLGGQWQRLRSTQPGDDRGASMLGFCGLVQRF